MYTKARGWDIEVPASPVGDAIVFSRWNAIEISFY